MYKGFDGDSPFQYLSFGILHFIATQRIFNFWLNTFSETIFIDFILLASKPIQIHFGNQNQLEIYFVCKLICTLWNKKRWTFN